MLRTGSDLVSGKWTGNKFQAEQVEHCLRLFYTPSPKLSAISDLSNQEPIKSSWLPRRWNWQRIYLSQLKEAQGGWREELGGLGCSRRSQQHRAVKSAKLHVKKTFGGKQEFCSMSTISSGTIGLSTFLWTINRI